MKMTKSKNTLLVIDGSNLAYRTYHKFRQLKTPDNISTGLIYGFLRLLHTYLIRFKPTDVHITFDTYQSKSSNFRLKLYPDYKLTRGAGRIDMDMEDFRKQQKILQKILKFSRFKLIIDTLGNGFESDDYIAKSTLDYKGKVIIISSDKDFCQLISKDISMYNPSKDIMVNLRNCEQVMGYASYHCIDYLTLIGDSSDNIPGYYGIGPKNALKFLKEFNSIEQFLAQHSEFPKICPELLTEVYNRNNALIDLHKSSKMITEVPTLRSRGLDKASRRLKLQKYFKKYRLNSFLDDNFIKIFI